MKTPTQPATEELAAYRAAARMRHERERRELAQRRERAEELARRAAILLREQFGATRVMLFGSLAHRGFFTRWSDVDLAAWGLRMEDTFRAIGAIMDLDAEIEINLVDVGACPPALLIAIEREGVDL